MPRARPLERHRLLNRVITLAAHCGHLDELGQLGTFGLAWLRQARHDALCVGCSLLDVDSATLDGLDIGRAQDFSA